MRRLRLPLLGVALIACHPAPARPPAPPPPPAAAPDTAPPAPPAPGDHYRAELDLDFEERDGTMPAGWKAGIGGGTPVAAGYEIAADDDAHHGAASLRIRATGGGEFAAVHRTVDAEPLRGKQVRLRGWIRTDGVAAPGWAGLWLRSDGGARRAFDNMSDRGLTGTDTWRPAEAVIDVPDDAVTVVVGALLSGGGTAWFDDLVIEVRDPEPARTIELAGDVVDPDGQPAGGAVVALVDSGSGITAHVTTGPDGRFRFATTAGAWGLSVHHPSGDGATLEPRRFGADTRDLHLAIERGDGVAVTAHVRTRGALPAGTYVEVARFSSQSADVFAVPVTGPGDVTVRLPRSDRFLASVHGTGVIGSAWAERSGDRVELDLSITRLEPPPPEVTAWVARAAVPLVSAEAGHGFADLAPIGEMIGQARLVALGEATHGTREFFQLKHRLLEYLVAEHGFTVFAIEANLPECRALNDYVLHGKGDPRAGLDGIYFWTWNTEEVLAMIEWMRAWNQNPAHRRKVQFVGFDNQTTRVAFANVAAFLKRVAPTQADAWLAPLAALGADDERAAFAALTAEQRDALLAGVAALEKRFDRHRRAWSRAAGRDAFGDARDDVRMLGQGAHIRAAGDKGFETRDLGMADNVDALLRRQPRGTRVVLWAHNGHVAYQMGAVTNMGSLLRHRHGRDYLAIGFAFGEGSFQAIDWSDGPGGPLAEHTLGPPPAWDVSAPFRATGQPIVALDLRRAPAGVVADWLAAAHPMRETGAVFTTEENMSWSQTLTGRFGAVIYVDKTTRARPNPGGQRPGKAGVDGDAATP